MLIRLLALFLTVAMWPGLSELVELTVHAAEHGDVAHAEDDDHDGSPLGEDEHGCSGTFHLCPCHHPTPVVGPTVPPTSALVPSEVVMKRGSVTCRLPPASASPPACHR